MQKKSSFRKLWASTALTGAFVVCFDLGVVRADEVAQIEVKAQDLYAAIETLSLQSGVQIVVDKSIVAARTSHDVAGQMRAFDALNQMISDPNLIVSELSDGSLVVVPKREYDLVAQSENLDLGTITLDSNQDIEPAQDPEEGYRAEQASTTTRVNLDIKETPATVTVITNDFIRDRNVLRTSDAIEIVPNVVLGGTRFGRLEFFTFRGFEGPLSISPFSFSGVTENGLPSSLIFAPDPAIVERIEFVKGSNSITSGAALPTGLVNRIIKRPEEGDFTELTFSAGSFDFLRSTLDSNYQLSETVRARLIVAGDSDGEFIDNVDGEQFTIAPSIEFDLFEGAGRLLLQARYQKFDGNTDRGIPLFSDGTIPAVRPSLNLGGGNPNSGQFTEFEDTTLYAEYEHEFVEGLSLNAKALYSNAETTNLDIYAFQPGGLTLPGDLLPGEVLGTTNMYASLLDTDRENFTGEIYLSGNHNLFGREGDYVVGTQFQKLETLGTSKYIFLGTDNVFNPVNNFVVSRSDFDTRPFFINNDVDYEQYSVFGQIVARPLNGLTLVAGARYDWTDGKVVDRNNNTLTGSDEAFTGRLGASYAITQNTNVFATYQTSFDPQFPAIEVGGRLIGPETGYNVELGAKTEFFNGQMFASLTAFQTVRRDVAEGDPLNPGFAIEVGEQTAEGLELEFSGEPIAGLDIIGSVGYVDARITKATDPFFLGRKVRGSTEYTASLFATYDFQTGPFRDFGIGGGIRYVDDLFFGARTTPQASRDGFTRVDALAYYRPSENFELRLNIENLLDDTFIDQGESLVSSQRFAAPRNYTLTASFRF
ncbi:MAG: TonB-dependent siderophore receptor [Pseudomonadota bacterium]